MTEVVRLGDVEITVTRKAVKHVYLSVHPPSGRVTLVAPMGAGTEVVRAFAATKLQWIRDRRAQLRAQQREEPRTFVTRESHYLWGRRYLLKAIERDAKPAVSVTHRQIVLSVRPRSDRAKRAAVMHEWHKDQLHSVVPSLLADWAPRLGVRVKGYFLQRMKTKWGSCNPALRHVRLNTELVKKPRELLEYVLVHELLHLRVPTHSQRFIDLMDEHVPTWREARQELNALPLVAERWVRDELDHSGL